MTSRFVTIIYAALIFLIPLFFSTLTPNFISTPKEIILTISTILILLSLAFHTLIHKKITLPNISIATPLLVFILSIIASLYFNPEGRPEALGSKGLILILLPVITFFLSGALTLSLQKLILNLLIVTSNLLSLHSLLSLTFLHNSPYLPSYMQNISFTPTGSYLTTLIFIISGFTLGLGLLKQAHTNFKPFLIFSLILNITGAVAIISLLLPGSALAPNLISYTASWSIALDALKSLRSLLFGIGLSNYTLLYSAVKPVSINLTPLWNTLPSTGTSELLTLLPTAGIIATLSLLYLMFKAIIRSINTPLFFTTILIVASFFLIPATLPLYFLFFLFISLTDPTASPHPLSLHFSQFIASFLLILTLILVYLTAPSYLSEYYMRQAQLALESNDSQRVYDLHLKAIKFSPKISNYHLSFAEINFRLASALSQKDSLSDTDRETITNLIKQSVLSGKSGIELRPNDSKTWLTVAKIYQNLINIADNSDTFAEQTFARALSLDRANPLLNLEYANLLSQLATNQKDPAQAALLRSRAISAMQITLQIKPDYANAYYNLAKLYESSQDFPRAISAMQEGLKYLPTSSTDYQQALTELENLKAKAPKPVESSLPTPSPSPTNLLTPSPLPSPLSGGPISLPTTE